MTSSVTAPATVMAGTGCRTITVAVVGMIDLTAVAVIDSRTITVTVMGMVDLASIAVISPGPMIWTV